MVLDAGNGRFLGVDPSGEFLLGQARLFTCLAQQNTQFELFVPLLEVFGKLFGPACFYPEYTCANRS